MTIIDKNCILVALDSLNYVKLDLGSGPTKKDPYSITIDILDYPEVDIVGDVFDILASFPANSVDEICTSHFLEHVVDLSRILAEIARVLKPNGVLDVVVPHFSNPYYYSDSSHKTSFGLYTFNYYAVNELKMSREVPMYKRRPEFALLSLRLEFRTTPKFLFRRLLKKILTHIVNLNTYTLELYEEIFCYLFPCYEICYRLRRIDYRCAEI